MLFKLLLKPSMGLKGATALIPVMTALYGRVIMGLSVCTACALRAHCVHIAHAEARILTQEYLSPVY